MLFTFFTRDFGRLDLLGRSIRKAGSKLKMSTSLFSHIEFEFIQGKSYNILTDAMVISSFREAKKDLRKIALFHQISETVQKIIPGEGKEEEVFFFLQKTMEIGERLQSEKKTLEIFYCFFSFRFLCLLGHKPRLEKCMICKKEALREGYFSPEEGGLVCKNCFTEGELSVYFDDLSFLKSFFVNDKHKISNQDPQPLLKLLENYLSFIT